MQSGTYLGYGKPDLTRAGGLRVQFFTNAPERVRRPTVLLPDLATGRPLRLTSRRSPMRRLW